jgi:hypothetical protein
MTTGRFLALIVLVAFAVVTFQPPPAEAIEPTTVMLIVGGAVIVIALVALLVIANLRERQRGEAAAPSLPILVAVQAP